ncbi:MAG: MarR family transcriptional regulator [Pirellulales bacterium]|nr:MarR family transcriptional regulator [Pirellulales bacterium]
MPTQPVDLRRAASFDSPEQEVYLNLWRTYDRLRALEDELFAQFELTAQQYNVLRLLAAHRPLGMPTLQLAARLVSRAPDITRIVDRLEQRGWIARDRLLTNRRVVEVRITESGVALLAQIAEPLAACHARQLGHLQPAQLGELAGLLRAARAPHESLDSPWK